MYTWHRKHSAAAGTEWTEWARSFGGGTAGGGGGVAGKEVTLVPAEVHRVHDLLARAHHLRLYLVQRHVVHRRAHVLGQVVHLSSYVVLSRSDGLLVLQNFSECDLI
jgi:hypothetical protein